MKKIKIAVIIAIAIPLLFLASCGGGGGGGDDIPEQGSTPKSMKLHQIYSLLEGQKIVKTSADAVIILETNIDDGSTIVTLQSGSANLE